MIIKVVFNYLKYRAKNFKFSLNPFYLYFTLIWIISKLGQVVFNHKHSIWEILWSAILNAYGKSEHLAIQS